MAVITIENVSKRYRKGVVGYRTLREDLYNLTGSLVHLRKHRDWDRGNKYMWALHNVSLEVEPGEKVGIIGRNGCGKTTLLRLLAGITKPTEGSISVRGRLGVIIEIMAGFHPELTGRENIYLNGAIMGMSQKDLRRKVDEIVDFAEIEEFIDTPIKRYSSGMHVRLGFAVAAHLEPDILLVDEVLAVGDAAFQQKCLGKMDEVAGKGRTVLFVSHNMQAVRQLCQRVVLMDSGKIISDGMAAEVTDLYLRSAHEVDTPTSIDSLISELPSDPAFRLENVVVTQKDRQIGNRVLNGEPLEIHIYYHVLERTTGLRVFFDLCDSMDTLLFRSFHDEQGDGIPTMEPGHYVSQAVIPADLLASATYELRILATVFNVRMCIPYPGVRIPLSVERTGKTNRAYVTEPIRGKLAPVIPWTLTQIQDVKPVQTSAEEVP